MSTVWGIDQNDREFIIASELGYLKAVSIVENLEGVVDAWTEED